MAELGSFCTSCGAKLEPGVAFCTICGAKRQMALQPDTIAVASSPVASSPVASSPEDFSPPPVETSPPVSTNLPEATLAPADLAPADSAPADIPPATLSPAAIAPTANPVFSTPPATEVPSVIALGEKPKDSGSKAIFVIIVLVILSGAAFGGWKYWQKSTRVEIEVSPDATSIPLGGSTHVEAEVPNPNNVDVIWSVREGSAGGAVTGAGALAERGTVKFVATYNAPTTPGTYHVVATLSDNSESTGETTITVGGAQ
jgi:hypothetical protein